MSLEELTLTLEATDNPNLTDPLEYTITVIQGAEDSQSKDAFSVAPPGLGPTENILLGVSGMQRDTEIRWAIHDDGTDKSNGTVSTAVTNGDIPSGEFENDTVVTLSEQVRYLQDWIHDPDFNAGWTLDHATGGMYSSREVFIETIDTPTILQDSPRWLEARMALRVGSSTG